jgi:hypothetical protein
VHQAGSPVNIYHSLHISIFAFRASKTTRLRPAKVSNDTCDRCNEKLMQRILTNDEYNKLVTSFSSFFESQCKKNKLGSMAEFNALQGLLTSIKNHPNFRYFHMFMA